MNLSILLIFREEDSGSFTCIAKNDAGETSLSMDLVVHGKK